MRARDVMTTDVVTVGPGVNVTDVAKLMLDRRISGLPVVDDGGRLVGIVTEGDLMRRTELSSGGRPWWLALDSSAEDKAQAYVKAHGMTVGDVMTKDVATIDEHDPLDHVAMLLEEHGIKRAPVMREGKIVGIVSRANLLQGLAAGSVGSTGPDDHEIRTAVLTNAQKDTGVRASLVDVTVANGVAHLWGKVASDAERDAVRVAAENTKGVREVRNHLRILPPSILALEPE